MSEKAEQLSAVPFAWVAQYDYFPIEVCDAFQLLPIAHNQLSANPKTGESHPAVYQFVNWLPNGRPLSDLFRLYTIISDIERGNPDCIDQFNRDILAFVVEKNRNPAVLTSIQHTIEHIAIGQFVHDTGRLSEGYMVDNQFIFRHLGLVIQRVDGRSQSIIQQWVDDNFFYHRQKGIYGIRSNNSIRETLLDPRKVTLRRFVFALQNEISHEPLKDHFAPVVARLGKSLLTTTIDTPEIDMLEDDGNIDSDDIKAEIELPQKRDIQTAWQEYQQNHEDPQLRDFIQWWWYSQQELRDYYKQI